MEDEKLIDQSQLAQDVSNKISYEFLDFFLVKPLDPIKVKKEFDKPVPAKDQKAKDADEKDIVDYDKVETEVKEVESEYRKGVILKVPTSYSCTEHPHSNLKVGDVVLFRYRASTEFDLLKDARLINHFNILAYVNDNDK